MYDHKEVPVRIAYYFVWDTVAGDYSVVWLCEECTAERDGDLVIAGDVSPEDAKRCEECDRPNEAALEEYHKRAKGVSFGFVYGMMSKESRF